MMRGRAIVAGVALGVLGGAGFALWQSAQRGDLVRTIPLPSFAQSIAVDQRTGHAFISTGTRVLMLDVARGAIVRGIPIPGGIAGLDERRHRVFVIDTAAAGASMAAGGVITTLDTRTGRRVGAAPVTRFAYDAALDEGSGRLYVLGANGAGLSILPVPRGRTAPTIAVGPDGAPMISSQDVALDTPQGRAFVVIGNPQGGGVSVVDTAHRTLMRMVLVGHLPFAVVADPRTGRAFAASNAGLTMIDAASGRVLRTLPGLQGLLAVDEQHGRVYSLAGRASITALDARSGRFMRTIAVPQNPVAMAVDDASGRVFVVSSGPMGAHDQPLGHGSMAVIDGVQGRLVRTVAVGLNPTALALDARQGQLLVLDGGGTQPAVDPWAWVPGWLRQRLPFLPRPPHRGRHVPPMSPSSTCAAE